MPAPHRPHSLLIIDDDAAVRDVLVALLMDEGFRCATAGSALEAMNRIEAGGIDLVVSDLKMPGHDGLWLLDRIQRLRSELPVLILTGHGCDDSEAECLRRGAAGFLLKPPSISDLLAEIERVLPRD